MSENIQTEEEQRAFIREFLDYLENYLGDDGKISAKKLLVALKQCKKDREQAELKGLRLALEKVDSCGFVSVEAIQRLIDEREG